MQRDAEAKAFDGVPDRVMQRVDGTAGTARGFVAGEQTPGASPTYSSIGNTASSPSPIYLSTSPPWARIAATWQSK